MLPWRLLHRLYVNVSALLCLNFLCRSGSALKCRICADASGSCEWASYTFSTLNIYPPGFLSPLVVAWHVFCVEICCFINLFLSCFIILLEYLSFSMFACDQLFHHHHHHPLFLIDCCHPPPPPPLLPFPSRDVPHFQTTSLLWLSYLVKSLATMHWVGNTRRNTSPREVCHPLYVAHSG